MLACSYLETLYYLDNTPKTYARFYSAKSCEERKNMDGYPWLAYLKDMSCSSYCLILYDGAGKSLEHNKKVSCSCLNFLHGNPGTRAGMVDDSVLFQHEAHPHPDSRATVLEYLGVQFFLIKENPVMTSLLNLLPRCFLKEESFEEKATWNWYNLIHIK